MSTVPTNSDRAGNGEAGRCGWIAGDGSHCTEPSSRDGLYCKKHKAEYMRIWRAEQKRKLEEFMRIARGRRFCRERIA
jgi:hypothetical protein